jgi:hypothetical protein
VEEALIEKEEPIVADEETAKVAQVSEGALDFPAFAIAPAEGVRPEGQLDGRADADRSTQSHGPPGAHGSAGSRKPDHK